MTARAAVLGAVVVVILVMITPSLGVYFSQRSQLAQAQARIDAYNASIADLQDEVHRWQDPAYVRARARSQLGWVVKGETGFRVIGPDGKVIGGSSQVDATAAGGATPTPQPWWRSLAGSVAGADHPKPTPKPSAEGTAGPGASGSPSPSPSGPSAPTSPSPSPSAPR